MVFISGIHDTQKHGFVYITIAPSCVVMGFGGVGSQVEARAESLETVSTDAAFIEAFVCDATDPTFPFVAESGWSRDVAGKHRPVEVLLNIFY